jgi:hypothetical protein
MVNDEIPRPFPKGKIIGMRLEWVVGCLRNSKVPKKNLRIFPKKI